MHALDGYQIEQVEPCYFIQQGERIVWPFEADTHASREQAAAMLPAFPGGEVVACNLVLTKPLRTP